MRDSRTRFLTMVITLGCLISSRLPTQAASRPAAPPEKVALAKPKHGADAKTVQIASLPGQLLGGTLTLDKRIVVLTHEIAPMGRRSPRSASLQLLHADGRILSALTLDGVVPVAEHDLRVGAVHNWGKRDLAIAWANTLYRVALSKKDSLMKIWGVTPWPRAVITGAKALPGGDLLVYGSERLEEKSRLEPRGVPIPVVARISPGGRARWVKTLPDRPRGRWQHILVEIDSFVIVGGANHANGTRSTPLAVRYSMEGKAIAKWNPRRAANAFTTAWHISAYPTTKGSVHAYNIAVNGYDYFGRGHTGDGITTNVFLDENLVPSRQVAIRGSDTGHRAFFLEHTELLMFQHRTNYLGPGGSGNPRIIRGNWGFDGEPVALSAQKIVLPNRLRVKKALRFGEGWLLIGNTVAYPKPTRSWIGRLTL